MRKHTHTLTHNLSLCCKLTHTLIVSKLSQDKGIACFLWLPQMSFPDLRDDVISFFERLEHLSNLGPLLCCVL